MFYIRRRQAGVSLVEVLIAMAILSTLALPTGMFLLEYNRGSSQLGDYYQILNFLEEKIEKVLVMNFADIPLGEQLGALIEVDGKTLLDLRPVKVAGNLVSFSLKTELLALDFAAMKDVVSGQLQKVRVDEAMKRIEVVAKWGEKGRHSLSLVAYRANL